MKCACPQCGVELDKPSGHVNRSRSIGAPVYCGRVCAGLGRRKEKLPEAERKEAKRLYDANRRIEKREELRAKKREYFQRTYDPEKARVVRKERMPKHVEYCRRPEYKAKKTDYDHQKRADEYGEFRETWSLLLAVEKELRAQASGYERRVQRGYYTRSAQQRRRDLWLMKQRKN